MAFSIRLIGIPHHVEDGVWTVDNVVWPIPLIQSDARFRRVILNSAYVDYAGVLTVEEAIQINEQYLDWGTATHWSRKNQEVQGFLVDRADKTSIVLVRMYEWESGLD
jgi:hypothetical protein